MGKYERKKTHKGLLLMLAAAVIVFVLGMVILSGVPGPSAPGQEKQEAQPMIPTVQPPLTHPSGDTDSSAVPEGSGSMAPAVEFPLLLEEGKLVVESVFQFEGINPDCGNREGDKTAAIIIRNTSDQYLKSATVIAELQDGSEAVFSVTHVPAGKEILAFAVDNMQLKDNLDCADVRVQAEFQEAKLREGLGVSVDGLAITVTNETGGAMEEIEIFCHGVFGDRYFGGVTYVYKIEELSGGESTLITAVDCFLGAVDVVRTAANNEK